MLSIADQLAAANAPVPVIKPSRVAKTRSRRFRGLGGGIMELMSDGQPRNIRRMSALLGRAPEQAESLVRLLVGMKMLVPAGSENDRDCCYIINMTNQSAVI